MKAKSILLLLCLFFGISLAFCQVPTNGLVLYLPMNGNANDSSLYANNGISENCKFVPDRFGNNGKAMSFNGINSYIHIPNNASINLVNNKSASYWIYIPSIVSLNNYTTVIYKDEPLAVATFANQINEEAGYGKIRYKFGFMFSYNSSNVGANTKQSYTNFRDQWLNITGTYDSISGYLRIYFNGKISDSTFVGNKKSNSSTYDLTIGRGKNDGYLSQTYLNGYLDDIRLYNRALSSKEVFDIYNEKYFINAGSNKTVVCGESVKLDSVTTNYSDSGTLKYKWVPSTNLNNDTIPNPICTSTSPMTYTVTVSFPEGSTASGKVTVTPQSFSSINGTTNYKYLTCGQSVKFDTILTNYTGIGKLKYRWIPSKGLDCDTIARPTCSVTQSTNYSVTITTPIGCSISSNVNVSVYQNYQSYTTYKTVSCGDTIKLEALVANGINKNGLSYKWYPSSGLNSDTISNPIAKLSSSTTYTYTVTSSSGCIISYGNVNVTFTKIGKPEIAYVNVDNDLNVISWDKSLYSGANSFNVYKETNVANTYSKITTIPYDKAGSFVDTLSSAKVQSNKYKLSILDNCGFETDLSNYHKTIHLSINKGVGTIWNLIWEPYEGFTVATYNIYRGSNLNNIVQIGSISGSNVQFSDYTAPTGDVFYQIEAVKSVSSSIKSNQFVSSGTAIISKSNTATNIIDGLNELSYDNSDDIYIFPNPASNILNIKSNDTISKIEIFDFTGKLCYSNNQPENNLKINISTLRNGIYMVKTTINNLNKSGKFVIQN